MAVATWAGRIGGQNGTGTANTSPYPLRWTETVGQTMVMIASQGRGLASGQTQDPVVWTPPDGWLLANAATRVDPHDGVFNGSFVSQAILTKIGDVNDSQTADLVHTGRSGGAMRVDIYGIDNSSPYVLTITSQGFVATLTPEVSVGFRDAMYVTAYADSSDVTPSWNTIAGFNQVSRGSLTKLGFARSQLFNESGFIQVPRITGGDLNEDRAHWPYIINHVVFGTVVRRGPHLGLRRGRRR